MLRLGRSHRPAADAEPSPRPDRGRRGARRGSAPRPSSQGATTARALGEALGRELATVGDGPLWDGPRRGDRSRGERDRTRAARRRRGRSHLEPRSHGPSRSRRPRRSTRPRRSWTGCSAGSPPAAHRSSGAERLSDEPSWISFFADSGVSSVDDVDRATGDVALALLLERRRARTLRREGHRGGRPGTAASGSRFVANAGG